MYNKDPQCSRTFLVYWLVRFADVSYKRFIAIYYEFKLSMFGQESLVLGRRGCVRREYKWGNS